MIHTAILVVLIINAVLLVVNIALQAIGHGIRARARPTKSLLLPPAVFKTPAPKSGPERVR